MLAECCYRLIPNGEVIHTHYDSDTKKIIGLPEKFFKTEFMTLPEYSMLNYRVSEVNFAMMTEAVLLSNPEYAIVVETAAIGYTIAEFNGDWRFVDSPLDQKDNSGPAYIPATSHYKAIGYRPTKLRQVRSCMGVYRLVLDIDTGLVHTDDGVLRPEFDVNSLDKLSYNYVGYKDCVEQGHYAVVYLDGTHRFVEKTSDNRLVLI